MLTKTPKGRIGKIAELNRLGCAACPLDKVNCLTPKMSAALAADTKVLFLAEAPGEYEDEDTGRPITGPSGVLVRSCIPKEWAKTCAFDNVINCRPEGDRTPVWQEIECCRPRRHKVIEDCKPKLIIGLGTVPLTAMLGSTDIRNLRGRFFPVKVGMHECYFMPIEDPKTVLDRAYDKSRPLMSKIGHCFRMDIENAFKILKDLGPVSVDSEQCVRSGCNYFDGGQPERILQMLEAARKAPIKAIDIETSCLRPYQEGAKILSIAISFDDPYQALEDGWATHFSFAWDHPQAKWDFSRWEGNRYGVSVALRSLLKDDTTKIAHKADFELEWFANEFGKEVVNHTAWECTMMQAHFLDERKGGNPNDDSTGANRYLSLDFLCKLHFGVAYKSLFSLNIKDMASSDLTETLIYNAVDTKYTLRLYHRQKRLLEERGLWAAYAEAAPRQPTVALMQHIGIPVDQREVTKLQVKLDPEISATERAIDALPVVQKYKNEHEGQFNPLSGPDTLTVFKDYLKRTEVVVEGGKNIGRYSLDKNVLDKIDHPLAKLLVKLRHDTKMKSTYVDGLKAGEGKLIYPDGRLHTSFHTTGTETGRLSCVAPWTMVLTKQGFRRIDTIHSRALVWTHKNRWQPVVKVWRKGIGEMVDVVLDNGKVLTCTKDHRLLTVSGQWVSVGEMYESFEKMAKSAKEHSGSVKALSAARPKNNREHCQRTWHNTSNSLCCAQAESLYTRAQGLSYVALLSLKSWLQKPHERPLWAATSPVGGGMQRSQGLFNYKGWEQAGVCAPEGSTGCAWFSGLAKGLVCAPHRWKSIQQSLRQFSGGKRSGAQNYTLQGTAVERVCVTAIKNCGSYEIFDLTVAEDESYSACGVFSHNSSSPNMQNFPKRFDAYIRRQVAAPPGHLLVAVDYSQLEGCTAAMCSKDAYYIKALKEDYDTHMVWAKRLVELVPDCTNQVDAKFRSMIKNKLVFPSFFGASVESVTQYLTEGCGRPMPFDKIEELMDEFWETFSGVKRWQNRLMKRFYEVGYVESLSGRRRNYPLSRNEAINHPVQATAAELVCDAMVRLSYLAVQTGDWHVHPVLNIHDDISFIMPEDEAILSKGIETVVKEMLTFEFPWINVPLAIEVSVGPNWCDMESVGKFWSHEL